jgi:WhiB family redox-sensing transcriptional regulator
MKRKRANHPSSVSDAVVAGSRTHDVARRAPLTLGPSDIHDPSGRADWRARAACRGMGSDLLFPTNGDALTHATRICARCPVVEECRTTALDDPSLYGAWVDTPVGVRLRLRSDEGLGWGQTDTVRETAESGLSRPAMPPRKAEA